MISFHFSVSDSEKCILFPIIFYSVSEKTKENETINLMVLTISAFSKLC